MENVDELVLEVGELVRAHYVFPEVAAAVVEALAEGVRERRYPADAVELAAAVTADLQRVSHDKHLRLLHHPEPLPPAEHGDDSAEWASMARWAGQTNGGIAAVTSHPGNVAYLNLSPVLFPVAIIGDRLTAAFTVLADADALIIDVRECLGGEPATIAFVISYLWDHEPVRLSGLRHRGKEEAEPSWTLPYVPGRRFGRTKPIHVLAGPTTFSGGEQLAYDLQQLGRATVVGGQTRGGANPREAFRVHEHLQVTVPVATSVSPVSGSNWEGVGVTPDRPTDPDQAFAIAYEELRAR